ncbi:unnamed protein product [Cyprideis torosa]|uniref:Uncharacterized protein n=1 Tax=Cyprideis torosa TaxID=163714 RepID=A0A7R8W2R9_9CRUS|nr:unnamed protein product [Cyprideis torosa]CAG0882243.1 unnamed protein product [Cyprideis torosa]
MSQRSKLQAIQERRRRDPTRVENSDKKTRLRANRPESESKRTTSSIPKLPQASGATPPPKSVAKAKSGKKKMDAANVQTEKEKQTDSEIPAIRYDTRKEEELIKKDPEEFLAKHLVKEDNFLDDIINDTVTFTDDEDEDEENTVKGKTSTKKKGKKKEDGGDAGKRKTRRLKSLDEVRWKSIKNVDYFRMLEWVANGKEDDIEEARDLLFKKTSLQEDTTGAEDELNLPHLLESLTCSPRIRLFLLIAPALNLDEEQENEVRRLMEEDMKKANVVRQDPTIELSGRVPLVAVYVFLLHGWQHTYWHPFAGRLPATAPGSTSALVRSSKIKPALGRTTRVGLVPSKPNRSRKSSSRLTGVQSSSAICFGFHLRESFGVLSALLPFSEGWGSLLALASDAQPIDAIARIPLQELIERSLHPMIKVCVRSSERHLIENLLQLNGNAGLRHHNIRPVPCSGRRSGESETITGICMFAWDCMKLNGTHLGTCIDRFYFGSCCEIPIQDGPLQLPSESIMSSNAIPPSPNRIKTSTTVLVQVATSPSPPRLPSTTLSSSSSSTTLLWIPEPESSTFSEDNVKVSPKNNYAADNHVDHNPSPYNRGDHNPSSYNPVDHNPSPYNRVDHDPSPYNRVDHNPSPYNRVDHNPSSYNHVDHNPSPYNHVDYNGSNNNNRIDYYKYNHNTQDDHNYDHNTHYN